MTQRETDQVASISGEKRVKLPLTLIWSGIVFIAGAASLGTVCYLDIQSLKKSDNERGAATQAMLVQMADMRDELRELRWTITLPSNRTVTVNKGSLTGANP